MANTVDHPWAGAFCRGVTSVTARDGSAGHVQTGSANAQNRGDETCDYETLDRRSRLHLSLSFPDESVWIVPGTESADD